MVPHQLSRLKNGLIRSIIKSSSIVSLKSPIAISFRTGRRHLSFLEATKSVPRPAETVSSPVPEPIIQTIPRPIEAVIDEEAGIMNSQKESELLAMQHIFGLKDAATDVKIKPKELERLERLKAAEPVFVCVDLEAFEFSQEKITEVGVSILDSRHVLGTDPGAHGSHWLSKIKTRHMIIKEHKHLVNKRFVHGCPDKFNFGASEFVSLKHIRNTLTDLFNNPTSESLRASDNGSRKLILVGHGLSNDTAYLNKLNFAPHAKGNILQDVDTQRFVGTKKTTVGLSKLMAGLGVQPENLHNAGNDAAYTMQGLVLMTVQHTNHPGAYLMAVTNAKGNVDPAKQRYKEHKAKIREKKAADEIAKLQAAGLAEQKIRQDSAPEPTAKSLFTGASREHQQFPAARQTIARSSVEPRPLWQAEQALLEKQSSNHHSHNPDSVGSTSSSTSTAFNVDWLNPHRSPVNSDRLPPSAAETIARRNAARRLREEFGDQIPSSKRISLVKNATVTTSKSDQAERLGPSRKRKSSDPEPVPNNHVDKSPKTPQIEWDDDDFSISPAFHLDGNRTSRRSTQDDQRKYELMADSQPHNGPVRRVPSKGRLMVGAQSKAMMNAESGDQPVKTTKMRPELAKGSKSHDGSLSRVSLKSDDQIRYEPMNRIQYKGLLDSEPALPILRSIESQSKLADSSEPPGGAIKIDKARSDSSSRIEDDKPFLRQEVEKHRQMSFEPAEEKKGKPGA